MTNLLEARRHMDLIIIAEMAAPHRWENPLSVIRAFNSLEQVHEENHHPFAPFEFGRAQVQSGKFVKIKIIRDYPIYLPCNIHVQTKTP